MSSINSTLDFIGGGITLPLKIVNGKVPIETGSPLIKASIRMILSWPRFSRFFLNEFGIELEQFLEEPNDHVLATSLDAFIREYLTIWETRIQLLESVVIRQKDFSIQIELKYKILKSQSIDTFIFPFYDPNSKTY